MERFKRRVKDIAHALYEGSTVTCFNMMDDDKFEEMLVKRGKFKKSITGGFESKEEGLEGITLHHHSGDTCLWEDAEECYNQHGKG